MIRLALSLVLLLSITPLAIAQHSVAQQSAVVIVLCENGGKTPAARTMTTFGRIALAPLVRKAYRSKTWLVGAKATPQAFLAAIRTAAKKHKAVDVILFAHGSPNKTHLAGGFLTGEQLIKGLKGRGGQRLRMVYTTTCYSDTFLDAWTQAGAYAVRGMSGVNRPLDFPRFMLGWLGGESYEQANKAGFELNQRVHKLYNQHSPRIKQQLTALRALLEGYAPLTDEGKKLRLSALDALRLSRRWFRKDRWDIEESRPKIRGAKARINQLPRKKSTAKPTPR